jgi:hypothetical protein
VYRDRPHTVNELKTAITAYIRNISQADLQKVLANKIKRVQACTDVRGFPNSLYISEMLVEKFNQCTLQLMSFTGDPSIVPLCKL